MTIFELLSVNSQLLKKLHDKGIKISDYKYLELYEKYTEMAAQGEKMTYIVSSLSSIYDVCDRTVYKLIELFSTVI